MTSTRSAGCLARCVAGARFGTEGTASLLVATAKAAPPRVSVTWSKRLAARLAGPRARGRDPNSSGSATKLVDSFARPGGNVTGLRQKQPRRLGGRPDDLQPSDLHRDTCDVRCHPLPCEFRIVDTAPGRLTAAAGLCEGKSLLGHYCPATQPALRVDVTLSSFGSLSCGRNGGRLASPTLARAGATLLAGMRTPPIERTAGR